MSLSKNRLKIMILPIIMISLVCSVFTFTGLNSSSPLDTLVSAQKSESNLIQIMSVSTYIDDRGNFHIIGEVNNTSIQPQTNVVITALLSNTTNNVVVGNHSAFSSIETLRTGELSPFDIVIQNPQQILGKFNFIEFSTTSQPAIVEKPANLVLNGSSSFMDNAGNPHIIGNIINQGKSSEQFLNLVATFYDNSSFGVVGTQSFGLNVGNLENNQMAPFDITITDNKTKSQGAFYSLNVDSSQSSMSLPASTKNSFVTNAGFANNGSEDGLSNSPPGNNPPVFVNNNDDEDESRSDDNDDDDDNDNGDNQRGEKKTDDEGNPWFDDENCSEESGSSGGDLSECEVAEREEESEREDEDSLEKDQGPPSNPDSDPTNDNNNDDSEDNGEESNSDDDTENIENNDDDSDGNNDDDDGDANEDDNN